MSGPAGLLLDGPHRFQFHRTLRLIMAAGGFVAGLCLVVGMVALVAAVGDTNLTTSGATGGASMGRMTKQDGRGGAGGPTDVPRSGSTSPAPQPTPSPAPKTTPPSPSISPAPGSAARTARDPGTVVGGGSFKGGRVVAAYAGTSSGEPGPFLIPRSGEWGIYWSYRCPPDRPGNFVMGETRTTAMAVIVDVTGSGSRATIRIMHDAGLHSLVVISNCSWKLQVVLPAHGH